MNETANKDLQKKVLQLTRRINYHNRLYYDEDKPEITDEQYDELYRELKKLETEHPELLKTHSPTQRIGGTATFAPIKHRLKMLSLEKAHGYEDLARFFKRILKEKTYKLVALPKLDGMAVSLVYKHSKLSYAATRGDGTTGEDITTNVKYIKGILKQLPNSMPPDIEVRGEILMGTNEFTKLNEYHQKIGLPSLSSPRNAASGTVRGKKPHKERLKALTFFAYWAILEQDETNYTAKQIFKLLEKGFTVSEPVVPFKLSDRLINLEKIFDYEQNQNQLFSTDNETVDKRQWVAQETNKYVEQQFEPIITKFATAPELKNFVTDGIVIRLNDIGVAKRMGSGPKAPKSMIAYKNPTKNVKATLVDIEFHVGRTGNITPVAKLDPVFVGDVMVTYVTLHNCRWVQTLNLHVGDEITITRSGDVIPKILLHDIEATVEEKKEIAKLDLDDKLKNYANFLKKKRNQETKQKSKRISLPKECPACNSNLQLKEWITTDEKNLVCTNPECSGQLVQSIIHFASRNALDIQNLGDETIKKLILEEKLVKNVADIFTLTQAQVNFSVDKKSTKAAHAIIKSIQAAKQTSLDRIMFGIGISDLGSAGAQALVNEFGNLKNIYQALPETLCFLSEIDYKSAVGIHKSLKHKAYGQIQELKELGVEFAESEPAQKTKHISSIFAHTNYLFKIESKLAVKGKWELLSTEFITQLKNWQGIPQSFEDVFKLNISKFSYETKMSSQLVKNNLPKLELLLESNQLHTLVSDIQQRLNIVFANTDETKEIVDGSLAGKAVIATGKFEGFTREQIHQKIKELGGTVVTSVTNKTNLVLAGEKPGANKIKKALELGIEIDEDGLGRLMENEKT